MTNAYGWIVSWNAKRERKKDGQAAEDPAFLKNIWTKWPPVGVGTASRTARKPAEEFSVVRLEPWPRSRALLLIAGELGIRFHGSCDVEFGLFSKILRDETRFLELRKIIISR